MMACRPPWELPADAQEQDYIQAFEDVREKYKDERDRVQKKTFTKWVNKHLMKAHRSIDDLYEDLRDGHNLISLLEVLSGDSLPREKGRMRFHKLQNVGIALEYLKHRQVRLVNIRNDDIADGNPKLTLGLIWTIILHFQISDIQVSGQSDDMTAKEKLLLWSQRMVEGYRDLRCDNFTSSWRDGKVFNAVIHRHRPMLIDMNKVYRQKNQENLEQAFSVAEKEFGVTRLLDPEDVDVPHPDEKSIITYVSSLYDALPRVPSVESGVRANEIELHWQEYYELVTLLLQWIRHHITMFEERRFPGTYEEMEVLWRQFLKFKESDLPIKEIEKNRSKTVFKSFEAAVQDGQLKVPAGYYPIDVEKEWGKLHVSILERERILRSEFERLERFQRIILKIEQDSNVCEEQLKHADSLLKADIRLANAGKAPINTAVLEHDLDKVDGLIRSLFNDVQSLKDGRHPQAEAMYRRVFRLHEFLVATRTDYSLRFRSGVQTAIQVPSVSTAKVALAVDGAALQYIQDLLLWVEENQRGLDVAEWGVDLPTVQSNLGSHRGLHQSIEEFRPKIERARADEAHLSAGSHTAYCDYLSKLDLQYAKLLNSSKSRLRHLESLNTFVSMATKELMWLNDKEEEEVKYDWSERNTNIAAKKDNYSGLMKELESRERKVSSIQNMGEKLLRDGHPAKQTIDAFMAALQTQWSWILQLCCCIEAHLKENTAYFQYFADVKDAENFLRKLQETMRKKYTCDRSQTVTRLEDLLQDSIGEKEQLSDYRAHLNGLSKRAKTIIQLKPRNPGHPLKAKLMVQAVCDYKQMEITVNKGDEYVLVDNSQASKWKVVSGSGSEALVPSVCFMVPPTNKEALDAVSRLESTHQTLVSEWHRLHTDMQSLLPWLYLNRDMQLVRSWTLLVFRSLDLEECKRLFSNIDMRYQDFLQLSQDSHMFGPDDRLQTEREYKLTIQHYEKLLWSFERGEEVEQSCKKFVTQLKDIRLQLDRCEDRTVHKIRQPLDREPLRDCTQRMIEQRKIHSELAGIKTNLDAVTEKTEKVLSAPEQLSSAPVLRSELDLTLQKMDRVYSLSSVYLEKLKTIEVVIRSTQEAEELVRKYERRLREVNSVPADTKSLEVHTHQLKGMRTEVEGHQPLFDNLEGELGKAKAVSEQMMRSHSERDVDLDRYRECIQQLLEHWNGIQTQIDTRSRELEQLGRQLTYYRQAHDWLMDWIQSAKERQEKIQAVPIRDSKGLKQQLQQEEKILQEVEKNRGKVEECEKFAKQYIDAIKDYELQLVTYKVQSEPVASPVKKQKLVSASDSIIQEVVDLRTRYIELMTLSSQYLKFITVNLHRLENEEKAAEKLKEEELKRLEEVEAQLESQKQLAAAHAKAKAEAEKAAKELQQRIEEEVTRREAVAVDAEQQKQNVQQEFQQLKSSSEMEIKKKTKMVEEVLLSRTKIEEEIRMIHIQLETAQKQKAAAESELQQLKTRADEADRQKKVAHDEAERLRRQVNDEAQKKKQAEEELKLKIQAEQDAAREKQKALEDLQHFKNLAEEVERKMKQAELEKEKQLQVTKEVAQKSAAAELQSKRMSFEQKTMQLEISLKQEHLTVTQLQEEAARLKKQQEDAENSKKEAEKELEKWQQKANEALRLRLQAEEVAHKKTLAQEEAERQKEEADREARRRAKMEESALRQKEMAEQELEKQRKLADETAEQKLVAEQELIRLRAETESGEQQRLLLEEELYRLKNEVNEVLRQRKLLEEELARVKTEMEALLLLKAKTEEETRSNSEKTKQILEKEAEKMKQLADEAARLRADADEAKRQRQLAEDDAAHQRSEADRILKEKLAAINEGTRLKTEAEMALKEKEAENERLRRLAEDEAFQRKLLEEQATQHKQDIEERILQLRKNSDLELERQKLIVEETLKHRRIIEEEIRILKLNFEKASEGKSDLEIELSKLKKVAEETQHSKQEAEKEAERQREMAMQEAKKRQEAERKVKEILAAEEEAARQRKTALDEVERLKRKSEEAWKQKELSEQEAEKQISLAQEAAHKRILAEEKAHLAMVQQKEEELLQSRMQEQTVVSNLKEQAERAKQLAEEAEQARLKAEQEAAFCRQQAEEAERLKLQAEKEAGEKARAQQDAEKLRKEAEMEAVKRAQAEQAALKQKQAADMDMEKHKKFAEQTLRQKANIEQELAKVKFQLDETDHQKEVLDEELQRLKSEVTEALKQKNQAEGELFKVKIQMEELMKLKSRIEEENKMLVLKDKDNTQKHLAEEAEKMKQLAEEAARLSVEAQETARQRKLAEEDLAQQRALAEKMLKEKMQAIQEASRLRAKAEVLQKQRDQAQEQAKKLSEAKQEMQQRRDEEAEEFQKALLTERRRQEEISEEAKQLKALVSELTEAQAKAQREAQKFKDDAMQISLKLRETEQSSKEKNSILEQLELQWKQSKTEAGELQAAIAELESEKEKLRKEAELLQLKTKEMEAGQKKEIIQTTQALQQTFLNEKEVLIKKERMIEAEKEKLEQLCEDELEKSKSLKGEQMKEMKRLEEDKVHLQASMEEALRKQQEAEKQVHEKQRELQEMEKRRLEKEKQLADENQALREKLEQLKAQKLETVAKDTAMVQAPLGAISNGRDVVDSVSESARDKFTFSGLRQPVPAARLQQAGILSKKQLDKLKKGSVTVQELSQKESVQNYLEGKSCVAGLIIEPSKDKMSIYHAMKRNQLKPTTATVLLEAQAATGFIIDPIKNRKLPVNEAIREGLVGPELQEKLLSAERAVTGYRDPYTGNQISLFEAMQKDLIPSSYAIRLLQAQVATGGIVDPVNSHRLPLAQACKQGVFNEDMNKIVSGDSDDAKAFFDPNTQENLTYIQLLDRCLKDPESGLCLLPLTKAAETRKGGYTMEQIQDIFNTAIVSVPYGIYSGKTITIWELINSEYFTEDQRRDLIRQYRSGKVTIEHIIKFIITTIDETETKKQLLFTGLRNKVPASMLLESKIIDKKTFGELERGEVTPEDVSMLESVRKYLQGSDSIAGVFVEPTQEKMSFYQAMKKNVLRPKTAEILLEAQAATGFLIDPVKNLVLTVDDAVKEGLVGPELHEKLLAAEKAVTGYSDPYTGHKISLFEAMRKELVPKEHAMQLLQAQVASGGIIDPRTSHRLPVDVAYQRGMFDEDMNRFVSTPSDDTRGFIEPNTDERVTYQQLKERCRKDPQTSLCLLPLTDEAMKRVDVHPEDVTKDIFQKAVVSVPSGRFSGKTITIWELINSEYLTEDQRQDLIWQYRSGKITIERIIKFIITTIDETETKKQLLFTGLRDKVPASELLESKIIDKKTFGELEQGKLIPEDVSKLESVKKYLQSSDSVAGVFVEPTKEKMSFYQAMKKNLLRPRIAEILLEAQAGTGFLIDPVKNRTLTVDDAVKDGLIGPELHERLLAAEKAVMGYTDPYTGCKISLFEAMKKELVPKEHAMQLLQAQMASGGIIDPRTSHRLPVDVAYKRGMFDEDMNTFLSTPSDVTRGFYDPNIDERVTYQQLKDKCIKDDTSGLFLLPLSEKAVTSKTVYDEEQTRDTFGKTTVSVPFGIFSGKTISILELINSEYFTEAQRKDLIRQYRSGKVTVEKIIKIVITVIEEKEAKKKPLLLFTGLRDKVPASELLESKIIDKKTFDELERGKITPENVSKLESISKYLQGSDSIAGVFVEPTQEKMSFYQAMKNNLLRPRIAEILLEAQAATGFLIDPVKNLTLAVDDAVKEGLVGPEVHEKLLAAEKAVTGYSDPYTGHKISLYEAMRKDLVPKDYAMQFLQAQLASGGIIDPRSSHRLPIDVAYERGLFDEDMNRLMSTASDDMRCFIEPNADEQVTYQQLKEKCRKDPQTSLCLLPLTEEAMKKVDVHPEEVTKDVFQKAVVSVPSGKFSGKNVTIWELINSEYFTEDQRRDLIRQYRSGKVTIEKIITIVVTIIEECEVKKKPQITFAGLRNKLPASELMESKIIDKKTFDELEKGKVTPEDVSKLESVKKYLQGSDSIAGVFVEPTQEKMSFYQAMKKNLLCQSTAETLLEAQAATGFLVDPVNNLTLTVDDAVKNGLVGPELHEKLLAAEKAVTGYTNPYTGHMISLFEAMRKGLVPKDHAVQLLQAQVASGGIIDPTTSHRLPVDVAYMRGMFDEGMNKRFLDAHDNTKKYIDPNTKEDVTYQQLKSKCILDPETGLCLLPMTEAEKPSVVESKIYNETEMQQEFERTKVEIPSGLLGGKSMSVWEILQSDYISEEERSRLTKEFQMGRLTHERLILIIIEIVEQVEIRRGGELISFNCFRGKVSADHLYASGIIDLEILTKLKEKQLTIQQVCEMERVRKFLFGTGAVSGVYKSAEKEVSNLYQAMKKDWVKPEVAHSLLEAQAATGFILDPVRNKRLTVDEAVREGVVGPELHDKLLSAERAVTGYRDPYTAKIISLFEAMKKELIVKDYALKLLDAQLATGGIIDPQYSHHLPLEVAFQRGYLDRETYSLLTDSATGTQGFLDPSTNDASSYTQLLTKCRTDEKSGHRLLNLTDRKRIIFKGLRKQITMDQLIESNIIGNSLAQKLEEGETTVEEVSDSIKKYLEGTSCISGVFVEASKERLSIYQAMKKGMIRPGTAFELLEAQAATGYMIDPIKNRKLTVADAVKMGVVGPEFKDKLLSAERAVTGYRDPYSGKLVSLFQAMQKGLILKDHGIRLLESQIATGGIIDPEHSHRLPVEVAYKRGLFDEEMNKILLDPGDDTKGFFDPNTEENLTYLQLKERCIVDPDTGLCLLPLKEKKRERKTSSKSSVRKRRVVIVDPETGKEMSVYEAYRKGLIDHQTYSELSEQECEWEEVTISSSDGVVKSMITDRRSGRQYDIDDALAKGLIDQGSLDLYRSGALSITEFADMLSGNMSGFRSRSSSVGSSSSYTSQQASPMRSHIVAWSDPTEETGPVAGILDTDTLEKVSITEAMHRNLVDNITGQRLLEAQACTGGIIDPNTGEKYSVTEAVGQNLVDKIMVDRINLAQKAFHGFEDPRTKTKMSAAQALKKGWLYYEAGQRFLEVQYLTGGLIEPDVPGRVSLDEALQKGTIDSRTVQKLRDVGAYVKYITCPKTKLKISYKDAMDRSMIEEGSGLRLLEASSQSTKGYYSPYNVSGTGSSAGSRSGSRTGSRTGSRRGSFDATGSGYSMSFSSSSYTSPSYGRRLSASVPGGRGLNLTVPQSLSSLVGSSVFPQALLQGVVTM